MIGNRPGQGVKNKCGAPFKVADSTSCTARHQPRSSLLDVSVDLGS